MTNDDEKELFKRWLSVPNVVVVLAAMFAMSLLKLTNSELASWVQAVGSVVAIIAAFSISQFQYRAESQRRKQEAHERSVGYGTRLLLLSREYDYVVSTSLDQQYKYGTTQRDKQMTWVLDELLQRLNSSMFDDLDEARNLQSGVLRSQIVGLLFTLRYTTSDEVVSDRDARNDLISERDKWIQHYQSLSAANVTGAEVLLEAARKLKPI